MSDFLLSYGIASYVSQDILIVPFQADFYEEVIEALRHDILNQLHTKPEIKGLIVDLSKVKLIDFQNMYALEQTLGMASILGVVGYLVGIQPSVTLALVELGYERTKINIALNIERATADINKACRTTEIHVDELAMLGAEQLDMEADNVN